MKAGILAAVLMLYSIGSAAETQPLRWRDHRPIADAASTIAVAAAISLDTAHALRADQRGHALGCEALRIGLAVGASELVKRTVHRRRPDGSDRLSFWSEHTALGMATAGWRYQVGVPVALGAGYFRMAADRHYLTDVAAGAGAGWLVSRVCQ